MSEDKKKVEKAVKTEKVEEAAMPKRIVCEDNLVEVVYTSKSVNAGQRARMSKATANLLAKKGKVIINK